MKLLSFAPALCIALLLACPASAAAVRVKDLGRFLGWRENALVGYGIVTGLAGSGDSSRNQVTQQALTNVLSRLGVNVTPDQVDSRNVAAVVVTAVLPPTANVGDRIDVNVSSIGDARSLVGGTLLMTPLLGPDRQTYGLAQGSIVVGGYRFDSNQNVEQKNYPTSGTLPGGATVETAVSSQLLKDGYLLTFLLTDPDVTTAERIADAINARTGRLNAKVRDAGAVEIDVRGAGRDLYRMVDLIENINVDPDALARVVINERSGTVVAGGAVQVSSVVISQGDIKISVTTDDPTLLPSILVQQDGYSAYGGGRSETHMAEGGRGPAETGLRADPGRGRPSHEDRGLLLSDTKLVVSNAKQDAVVRFPDTTVADLVEGLTRVHVDTRGVIAILQAIKAAGALHAEIIVQ